MVLASFWRAFAAAVARLTSCLCIPAPSAVTGQPARSHFARSFAFAPRLVAQCVCLAALVLVCSRVCGTLLDQLASSLPLWSQLLVVILGVCLRPPSGGLPAGVRSASLSHLRSCFSHFLYHWLRRRGLLPACALRTLLEYCCARLPLRLQLLLLALPHLRAHLALRCRGLFPASCGDCSRAFLAWSSKRTGFCPLALRLELPLGDYSHAFLALSGKRVCQLAWLVLLALPPLSALFSASLFFFRLSPLSCSLRSLPTAGALVLASPRSLLSRRTRPFARASLSLSLLPSLACSRPCLAF